MKNCLINCSIESWYPKGGRRLKNSLNSVDFTGDILISEKYPIGCPSHKQVPYAFKIYKFIEAKNKGYKNVLWVDSSFYAIKNIDEVFNYIESNGWLLHNSGHNVGTWSTDKSLEGFNLSRDDAFKIPMFSGGLIGLNFKNNIANEFLNQLFAKTKDGSFVGAWRNINESVSKDPRVQGHRHDMTIGSVISNRLNMNMVPTNTFWTQTGWYNKYKDDLNLDTSKICFLAQGM